MYPKSHTISKPSFTNKHKSVLTMTPDQLFEIWRSLDVRLYIEESVETAKQSKTALRKLRNELARTLQLSESLRESLFEAYYQNVLLDFEHNAFHNVIERIGYEDEELESMTAKELLEEVCKT
jgi:predicted solute-binding protein